jgi:hypothetical protein
MSDDPRATVPIEFPPESARLSPSEYRRKWLQELSAEEKEAFLTRVRQILAGPLSAEPLQAPPVIEAVAQRELTAPDVRPYVTAEARRRIINEWTLDYYYGGSEVAYLEKDGQWIVLAVGPGEVSALLRGIPTRERSKVRIVYPLPC